MSRRSSSSLPRATRPSLPTPSRATPRPSARSSPLTLAGARERASGAVPVDPVSTAAERPVRRGFRFTRRNRELKYLRRVYANGGGGEYTTVTYESPAG